MLEFEFTTDILSSALTGDYWAYTMTYFIQSKLIVHPLITVLIPNLYQIHPQQLPHMWPLMLPPEIWNAYSFLILIIQPLVRRLFVLGNIKYISDFPSIANSAMT